MRWVWALASLGLFSGCVKRMGGEAGEKSSAYYPLQVGNHWSYQGRFLGQTRTSEVEILRQQDGFFEDNLGAKLMQDAYGIRDEKRYLLRDPVRKGQSWTNVVSISSAERYAITEVGVGCETPAGRFSNCVKVVGRNRLDDRTTLVNELTFAAGVGLVRLEVAAEAAGKRIPQSSLELTSYRLQP